MARVSSMKRLKPAGCQNLPAESAAFAQAEAQRHGVDAKSESAAAPVADRDVVLQRRAVAVKNTSSTPGFLTSNILRDVTSTPLSLRHVLR